MLYLALINPNEGHNVDLVEGPLGAVWFTVHICRSICTLTLAYAHIQTKLHMQK